jgi:leucyl/phenylalanyl-tRNA---protein transferase
MSHRGESIGSVEQILGCYYQGYFPLYDWFGRFYWERPPERAILTLDTATSARATRMLRRAGRGFTIEHDRRFEQVLKNLSDPKVKPFTWVRPQVMDIYRRLHEAGFIHTVEAVNERGQLAGALLGIMLPNVLIAETMFTLEADASKACLCHVVRDLHTRGFAFIDVQTPHERPEPQMPQSRITRRKPATPHPCVRLGETTCSIGVFLKMMHQAIERKVDGSFGDYVSTVQLIKQANSAYSHRQRDKAAWDDALGRLQAAREAVHAAASSLEVVGPNYSEEFISAVSV